MFGLFVGSRSNILVASEALSGGSNCEVGGKLGDMFELGSPLVLVFKLEGNAVGAESSGITIYLWEPRLNPTVLRVVSLAFRSFEGAFDVEACKETVKGLRMGIEVLCLGIFTEWRGCVFSVRPGAAGVSSGSILDICTSSSGISKIRLKRDPWTIGLSTG
ncbi:hypothetical protein V6N11_008785 [Hibiscus sabdariffa]|uniref:Uncharacterized protein n=1 Tax=Hibiscus sabdariffa TaxID=183260 RepID=A0ABR2NQM8_9ROSI